MAANDPPGLPKAILFDWDNTLVDTWPVIHDSMNVTLTHMGWEPWTMDETRARVRRALREAFPDMFGDRWEEARDVFYERFHAIHLERLAVISGARELLDSLTDQSIYLGVVSNKNGENLRREAAHLGWSGYFSALVGATDAPKDKPATDPVHLALKDSGVEPGPEVWFIGDTDIDMECAHNSGCIPILIANESKIDPNSTEFVPEMRFSDLDALRGVVLKRVNSIL